RSRRKLAPFGAAWRPMARLAGWWRAAYERASFLELSMSSIRVAIAGLGAIGRVLARRLADGVPGLTLACAAARDRAKAQAWLDAQKIAVPLVDLDALPQHADIAVECAPAAVIEDICRPMLAAGKRVMVLRAAAAGFPENVNVVAALSLAGIGPDRTTIEIWADPAVKRNCHDIEVDSDSARFSLSIENIPSENPKTGRITALSVLAALRKLN